MTQPTAIELARTVKNALNPNALPASGEVMYPGPSTRERVKFIHTYYANAVRIFGTAGIYAAASNATCKWCVGRPIARVRKEAIHCTRAMRELMGDPCPKCLQAFKDDLGPRQRARYAKRPDNSRHAIHHRQMRTDPKYRSMMTDRAYRRSKK